MRELVPMVMLAVLPALSAAASFDCAKAATPQEKMICGSAELARLDEQGARAYAAALSATSDKSLVKAWQRDWLRSTRNGCTEVDCLRKALSLHNGELDEFAHVSSAGPTVSGLYERFSGDKPDRHAAQIMVLALRANRARVHGTAIWVGNAATGSVHTGEAEGLTQIVGGMALLRSDSCRLAITFARDALTVEEAKDSSCGGMNVTFDGNYRKSDGTK